MRKRSDISIPTSGTIQTNASPHGHAANCGCETCVHWRRTTIERAKRVALWEAWRKGIVTGVSLDAISRYCHGEVVDSYNRNGYACHLFVWPGWSYPLRNARGVFLGYRRIPDDPALKAALNRNWDRIRRALDPLSQEHRGNVIAGL